jgi:hypothetical protein
MIINNYIVITTTIFKVNSTIFKNKQLKKKEKIVLIQILGPDLNKA